MSHLDHSHNHVPEASSLNRIFVVCISLNFIFVLIEAGVGFQFNSVGLLSDAGHNLSDVFSLLLALIAFRLSTVHATKHFTYGYKKSTILVSLINAIVLLVAVGAIIVESIYKIKHPVPISGTAISWTAGVGIIVNGVTAWLLMKNQSHDLNVRGAFLHMVMDTLVSVGVVLSGILIAFTGWVITDAIVGLVIAAIILLSTWNLLKESVFLSMDAVPSSVHYNELEEVLSKIQGVESWHHLHVWAISTTEIALTVHVKIKDVALLEQVKINLKTALKEKGIQHSTIEFESPNSICHDNNDD